MIHENQHMGKGSSDPIEDRTEVLEENKSAPTGRENTKENVQLEINVEPNAKLEDNEACRDEQMAEATENLGNSEYQSSKRRENINKKSEETASEHQRSKHIKGRPNFTILFDETEEIIIRNGINKFSRGWIDVHARSPFGITLLHGAVSFGAVEAVRRLLKRGADVNKRDEVGTTPLMLASHRGYVRVMEMLISAGADVNVLGDFGQNALLLASHFGHFSAVKLLLSAGCDPNHRERLGWTPLHSVADSVQGRGDVAQALLEAGASLSARDMYGQSPLDLAIRCQNIELITLFKKHLSTCGK